MSEFLDYYDSVNKLRRNLDAEARRNLEEKQTARTFDAARRARVISEVIDRVLDVAAKDLRSRGIRLISNRTDASGEQERRFRLENDDGRSRSRVYAFVVSDDDMVRSAQIEVFGLAQKEIYRFNAQVSIKSVDEAFCRRAVMLAIDNLMRI